MRPRRWQKASAPPVRADMTPLIDVVFQLLAFFVLTLKVVAHEGDFIIRLPQAAVGGETRPGMLFNVRLRADESGELLSIDVGERRLGRDLAELQALAVEWVGLAGAAEAEVEIDADQRLRYQHTMEALGRLTGYRTAEGAVVPLFQEIRLTTAP